MHSGSTIEISQSALKKNIQLLRNTLSPGSTLCSVIKGNAYGHGIEQFVPMAEREKVRHFAVANDNEAYRAFEAMSDRSHLMVMGDMDASSIAWAVENKVSFWVFSLQRLKTAVDLGRTIGEPALVHLELETGLNRTGLEEAELPAALELILDNPEAVKVLGICTHFAGAESLANYVRIEHQMKDFKRISTGLLEQLPGPVQLHTACSAAVLNWPHTHMDLARIGIAQYGFWPSEETRIQYMLRTAPTQDDFMKVKDPLRRILRWKTQIMDIKKVTAGQFISYGMHYLAKRNHRIATIPVGYYHGFPRKLSNYGHVLIRGKKAPVVGMVNMNITIIDLTDIPHAAVGDEVVIIGRQGKAEITVTSFSEQTSLLNYEVLVRLPADIPRIKVR